MRLDVRFPTSARRGRLILTTYRRVVLLAVTLVGATSIALAQSPTPTVQFDAATYTFSRTCGTASVTVTLSAAASDTVTVQIASSDGSATVTEDYGSVSGTVTIPKGSTSATVSITINNNSETNSEDFILTLSNPSSNAALGDPATATVYLGSPSASVAFDYTNWTYSEADGTVTVSVTMTGTPSGTVSVHYSTSDGSAASGVNYYTASGTLTWGKSDPATQTLSITLIDDSTVTPTLTVNLTLSNPVNATLGQATAVLQVADADGPCTDPGGY